MKKFNEAIDNTRRQEIKELAQDGREQILKHSRWCLLKNKSNQKESELAKLKELVKYNLKSIKCVLLRDSFQKFWTYKYSAWAKKFFEQWLDRVQRSNLDEMKKVANTLENHRDLLFNWFKTKVKYSNSIVEGFNNKAKLAISKIIPLAFLLRSCLKTTIFIRNPNSAAKIIAKITENPKFNPTIEKKKYKK